MNITSYELNKILNHIFGGSGSSSASYTPVANWYLGMSRDEIDTSGCTITGEPSEDENYSRVAIPNNKSATGWTIATAGSLTNASTVTCGSSTIDQGTILSIFLSSSSAVGASPINYYYEATPPFPVLANTTITFDGEKIVATIE